MRVMSFSLTTEQMRNKTKTVTRRLGWKDLQPGTLLHAVERARGLKRHERVSLGIIRVVSVRRERLWHITRSDVVKEGFSHLIDYSQPRQWPFITMFCQSHGGCDDDVEVTRIEFEFPVFKARYPFDERGFCMSCGEPNEPDWACPRCGEFDIPDEVFQHHG